MFWKRPSDTPKVLFADRSQRSAYRVAPDCDEPVILVLEGQLVRVYNISAGGFSCDIDGLKCGHLYSVKLNLPDMQQNIDGQARLLSCDERGHCHFAFYGFNDTQQAQLHYYVLQCQKRSIRKVRELSH